MATSAQIRQQLVDALQLDLIGPGWDDVERRHERLPQPPSIWYTTGFLVPKTFQEEAGRPPEGNAPSYADQAGEDPSNDASIRQEQREGDDYATGSQEGSSSKRNWFPRPIARCAPSRSTSSAPAPQSLWSQTRRASACAGSLPDQPGNRPARSSGTRKISRRPSLPATNSPRAASVCRSLRAV